jgi:hypothetical protein
MSASKRPARRIKLIISILALLVVVFYAGGGIVFSNMIHADALTPLGPTPDNGVYVRSVAQDSITLTSNESREDTTRPGLAGLVWEGGYGEIGEIVEIDGLDVTRRFRLITGPAPSPCVGALADCIEVDIEGWTYQSDPSDVGLAFDEVSFGSPLGDLGAWRVDAGDGLVWAIHAHGWRASRREALRSLPTYHHEGFTSLVVDYRNDEEAPADPSGLYRFGRTEWEDVEAAVRYALDEGAESIVLVGYSTGAALHVAFLESSELAATVTAAVYDSPNIDMGATVKHEASKRTIPGTPVPVPGSLTAVAMLIADLRWDIDWRGIGYVERAGDIIEIPTLVFHGVDDDRVPIEVSRRLRDQAPDQIRLIEVEEAGHVTSWNVDSEAYERALAEFLDDHARPNSG